MQPSGTNNHTYEHYGSVLAGTAFENAADSFSYLPYLKDTAPLGRAMAVGRGKTAPNRIAYQPMEGQDADGNGAPTDITLSRYTSLARGGAGLIWVEAVAVCTEGKSNPYQLELTAENAPLFRKLVQTIKAEGEKVNGTPPIVIMQMTHSGRYSKPDGVPAPLVAYRHPILDDGKTPTVLSDEYLAALPEKYAASAGLAEECGFDGVDIKCCHGYLLSELLTAYDRTGRYGGDLDGRTRLLSEIAEAVDRTLSKDTVRACRLNVYDGYGDGYSFCETADGSVDLTEALAVIRLLKQHGVTLLNVTMGSPYRNPDVSRPYRRGLDMPKTNAVAALSRLFAGAAEIKKQNPELAIVNTGISLLGGLAPEAAAGLVDEGMTDFVGFGRMSFAYPALAADILHGQFDPKRACVACGGCSYLKKNVQKSGCIIRNSFYNRVYKDFNAAKAANAPSNS